MVEDIIFEKLMQTDRDLPDSRREINSASSGWSLSDMEMQIQIMEKSKDNYAHREITSHRMIIGGLIVFGKRIVRKFLKWYIDPICFQQTEYNNANAAAVDILYNKVKENEEILKKTTDENMQLKDQIHELKAMLLLNQKEVAKLNSDMNCIKEVDLSIFNRTDISFFDKKTNSQSGEDSIIAYILMVLGYQMKEVSYLDLGANHARELSNTYYFYNNGASGVLVEANPALIPELKLLRSRDIILNYCVSAVENDAPVDFYILSGDGLSTPSKEGVENVISVNPTLELVETVSVKSITVEYILRNYFEKAPTILSIDIEGNELEILHGVNFDQYRPVVIVLETIPYETSLVIEKKNTELVTFLEKRGYIEYAFTGINSIFVDRSRLIRGEKK